MTKAGALFNQGLQEEGLTLTTLPPLKITYPKGSPHQESEIRAARQMWQTVLGINIQPDPIDFKLLLIDIENTLNSPSGLQMWAINWIPDYPDPRDWTMVQFDEGSS